MPTYTDYKAEFNANWVNLPINVRDFYTNTDTVIAPGMWDVEFKYQPFSGASRRTVYSWNTMSSSGALTVASQIFNMRTDTSTGNRGNGITSDGSIVGPGTLSYVSTNNNAGGGVVNTNTRIVPVTATGADAYAFYTIGNLSNKRNTSAVYTYGNDISGWSYGKYEVVTGGRYGSSEITHETLTDTLDTRQARFHTWPHDRVDTPTSYTSTNLFLGAGGLANFTNYSEYNGRYHMFNCMWYYIKFWHNYYLEHYFIPLPKGTWLADGRQMPYDGFFDVITSIVAPPYTGYLNNTVQQQTSIYPTIYRLGEAVTGSTVDFFERWDYAYDDVNYVVRTTETIKGYKHPDKMSEVIGNDYYVGTIMPITKVTSDSTNRVKGTWYFNGFSWVEASKCEVLPSNDYPMTALRKTVAVKDTTDTATSQIGYYNPFDESYWYGMYCNSETVIDVYFTCRDKFYWDGRRWVAIASTADNVETDENTYIVAIDYLPIYRHPIANSVYQTGRLQLGDRVQAIAHLTKNNNWVKFMVGAEERWINVDNTTSILE